MNQQLMPQPQFRKIISNQSLIIEQLQKSHKEMSSFLELSNKYLAEAMVNFQVGQGYVVRIRQNLDVIHRIMGGVKRRMKKQLQEERVLEQQRKRAVEQDKQGQIKTIAQSISDSIQQQIKLTNSEQPLSPNPLQTTDMLQSSHMEHQPLQQNQPHTQPTQIDKLFLYYKLDSQQYQPKSLSQPMFNDDTPTKQLFQQPFKIIGSSKQENDGKQSRNEVLRLENDYMLI